MQDRDVWAILCSRLENDTIRMLSHTCHSIHSIISSLAQSQLFYYLRTKYVLNYELSIHLGRDKHPADCCWKKTLALVKQALRLENPFSIANDVLSIHVLLQLGYDPSVNDSQIFITACAHGRARIVTLLLADKRVNPATKNGEALEWAVNNGHSEVVQLLLEDGRIDPRSCSLDLLEVAYDNEDDKMVQLLLGLGRVEKITKKRRRSANRRREERDYYLQ